MDPQSRVLWAQVARLVRPHLLALAAGIVCMVVARVCSLVPSFAVREFLDRVIGAHQPERLAPLALMLAGAALMQGLASFGQMYLLSGVGQSIVTDLRCKLQAHVARLPVSYFDSTKTGAIVSRIITDVEAVRNLVSSAAIEFIGALFTSVVAAWLMLRINVTLTLICLPVMGGFCLLARHGFRALKPVFKERSQIHAAVVGRLTESINGVRVVKAYRAEAAEARVFAAGMESLKQAHLHATIASSRIGFSGITLLGLLAAIVLFVSGRGIEGHTMTVGDYMMFASLLTVFVSPVSSFIGLGAPVAEAFTRLNTIDEILAQPAEDAAPRRTHDVGDLSGEVVFDDVSFGYDPEKLVLHHLSFRARPDSVTALVGPSGAGKSTLISLVAGFSVPTSGTIQIDDVDLATVRLGAYRRQLAVVLQDTFLFDGTIRENVAFSRPDATEADIMHACRVARVDEFARTFPSGYDTIVGERGVKLSGGQKQRVSIARAILADPRILILDEATSSLDVVSETLIQDAMANLMRGRTTFVIAHRLSTIRQADQILVLDKGRIVERGTHDSLYAAGELYYRLCTKPPQSQAPFLGDLVTSGAVDMGQPSR